ncbi:MAG: phosphomannomutase [Pseudomonadota bacterium]|nr:phosphomannomutase [Pseudomonadota bacterium]
MPETLTCFKAYDVRGRLPDQLNEEIAYRIGRAFGQYLAARRVVVGQDVRLSSPDIANALMAGLMAQGVDCYDIGLCGTEEVYFATFHKKMDGGVMVTASHNPADYNGMKFVRQEARPLTGDTGLPEVKELAEANAFFDSPKSGKRKTLSVRDDYISHLLGYVDRSALKPLKLVINAGNGCAGPVVDALAKRLPFEIVRINHEPDGHFPNGIPNPLLPENRAATAEVVVREGADMGIAWDGDFDRCFMFDGDGQFIEGYYMVGLLGKAFAEKQSGAKVVYDPRMTWNTVEMVEAAGGVPVESKAGHAFMKERMRREDAVYGGEMSAHHYFRDFAYCDSGMIPWLLVAEMISKSGKTLAELTGERMRRYPASGEINLTLPDPKAALEAVESRYRTEALTVDHTDGVGMEFPLWRFNVRPSNTEPVVRLNVESRGDFDLMKQKTDELVHFLKTLEAA